MSQELHTVAFSKANELLQLSEMQEMISRVPATARLCLQFDDTQIDGNGLSALLYSVKIEFKN